METGGDDSVMLASDTSAKVFSSSAGTKKSCIIHLKDAERVKSQLDEIWNDAPENAPFMDEEGDLAWGPIVFCDKITWDDFNKQWLDVYEGEVRCWVFEPLFPHDNKCGRVLIYSSPSRIHSTTAGKIMQMIIKEV